MDIVTFFLEITTTAFCLTKIVYSLVKWIKSKANDEENVVPVSGFFELDIYCLYAVSCAGSGYYTFSTFLCVTILTLMSLLFTVILSKIVLDKIFVVAGKKLWIIFLIYWIVVYCKEHTF